MEEIDERCIRVEEQGHPSASRCYSRCRRRRSRARGDISGEKARDNKRFGSRPSPALTVPEIRGKYVVFAVYIRESILRAINIFILFLASTRPRQHRYQSPSLCQCTSPASCWFSQQDRTQRAHVCPSPHSASHRHEERCRYTSSPEIEAPSDRAPPRSFAAVRELLCCKEYARLRQDRMIAASTNPANLCYLKPPLFDVLSLVPGESHYLIHHDARQKDQPGPRAHPVLTDAESV